MKILIAPDSFKGSLSAKEICRVVKGASEKVFTDVDVISLPVADGGEGSVDSILETLNGKYQKIKVNNPLYSIIDAEYGLFNQNEAIIEMAKASGLPLIKTSDLNIMEANTFGTGELILDALNNDVNKIYIGLGGSATNDGGIGCLNALGVKFLDINNNELKPIPANLIKIADFDMSAIDKRILTTEIILMCDVNNPLLNEFGATAIFSKQKGANPKQQELLEAGLEHFSNIVKAKLNKDVANTPGVGAAGGLGYGLLAFLNADIKSGIESILDILKIDDLLTDVDICITGEGKMDEQSAFGKVASGVANRCKNNNIPCFAIVGGMDNNADVMYNYGITSIITTINGIMSIEDAIKNAEPLLENAAIRLFRTINYHNSVE